MNTKRKEAQISLTLAIPCVYNKAFDFHEGLARVKMSEVEAIVNNTGCVHRVAHKFCLLLGKEGKRITSCKYDLVLDCSEGLAWVRLDWKDGYIDRAGCEIMPFGDFKNYNLGEFHDGMARVEMGGKYGYLKG